jgi:hypothetical protein
MKNTLFQGDPLDPNDTDIIIQETRLDVGKTVPDGWRVMSGNKNFSSIMRISFRFEIETV